VTVQGSQAVLRAGETEMLVRSAVPLEAIHAVLGGQGLLRARGMPPLPARPTGAMVELPVAPRHTLRDAAGREEVFSAQRLTVEGEVLLRFGEVEAGPRE
jgi:hypothetical protein